MATVINVETLTYQKRIDALRETKLAQTQEKQRSSGRWTTTTGLYPAA